MAYSAIHKAAVQNDLRRSFLPAAPIDSQWTLFCSTGIVPGKAGNGSAGGFVISAVTALFTKLPAGGRNDLRDRSPIHGFRVFQELYQAKLGTALLAAL